MASAWGPHLEQVMGMPVRLSCDSGGGQKGRAVGGGSIHKLPRALPGRNGALSPLGARRSTLAPWHRVHTPLAPVDGGGPGSLAVGPVAVAACACSKTGYTPHVLPHPSVGGVRFVWPRCACDFRGVTSWATPGVAGMRRGVCPPVGRLASGLG